ncbi:MAG: Gfo/Idh/MocA family oxidoreductase [Dehalococcoidia bacterium]
MALGVAVFGTGRIGGRYIDVVKQAPGAELKVVAEPREEQVAPLKKQHPEAEFVADYKQALERDDVDVIVGTLPHWLHKQAAIDSANAGKHIYLEKPMAVTLAECDEMLAAARANNVKIMTAHTQRYFPVVAMMKEVVESKQLGDLLMVHDVWHKPYEPEKRPKWMLDRKLGGGMGQMDGTHMIDRTLWIVGNDVATVSAQVGAFTYPELPCDDTSMAFIRWKSGVVATLSRIAWKTGITEYGADYFFTNGQAKFRIAYGSAADQQTGFWIGTDGEWKSQPVEERNSFLDEFSDFVAAIARGDEDTPIPQMHGRNVMEVLEATETSAQTGHEVVLDK